MPQLGIAVFLFHLVGTCRSSFREPSMSPKQATKTNIFMPFISSTPRNSPTVHPIITPSADPTSSPTEHPIVDAAASHTFAPSLTPTTEPTATPTENSIKTTTASPISSPTEHPTMIPTNEPTASPTDDPTLQPTAGPTAAPTEHPTMIPTNEPTASPTDDLTLKPTHKPTASPTDDPTLQPTAGPTAAPTEHPTMIPTNEPAASPTEQPTLKPTASPTAAPTDQPTLKATVEPTISPSAPPTMIPTEYPSSLHIAAKTLTPTADSAASRTDHPSLFATALTDKPTLTIVYALQANVLVTMAQMVAEMDVSSTETFRNITQAFLSNWLQFQVPPVSHVKVTVLNQSLSKLTLRRRVAQATDIVISMLVSGDTKVGDMDLAAICNTIFDDKGHILVDRLQATNDISFSQVMTVTSTNHTPVAVVEGGSKTSPVEGGTTSTGTSNLWAIFSIYIWVAIFVGGIAFLIASFGTMRFIYKRRNAVKEREEHKFQEEEPMSTGPASVVSTVLSRNTDFDSTLDYSVVEKKRSFHRQSRQTLKPLFEDGISRNSETTGGDTGPLGLGPQCVCGCKQLGCTCALNLAVSESL